MQVLPTKIRVEFEVSNLSFKIRACQIYDTLIMKARWQIG